MNGYGPRAGVSAPEALVALLLGLFIVHLGLDTLARVRSAQAAMAARSDVLLSTRIGRNVLRRELRHSMAGRDWTAAPDSLALRAFRGYAMVCSADSTGSVLLLAYHGDRAPDPSKDSVLLIAPEGATHVRALVAVRAAPAPCALGGGEPASWQVDEPPPDEPAVARLFEHGSYHLSGNALRYRPRDGGRQPLTPEVLSDASRWVAGASLAVELQPRDSSAGVPWSGFLAWRAPE